jgi:hypothetical protein
MARLLVDVDDVMQLDPRKRQVPDDTSCADGVKFGNVTVDVENFFTTLAMAYYEVDNGLRKADIYVIQKPFKISEKMRINVRTSVAFIGVRKTTAFELAVALLDLTRQRRTRAAYEERVEELTLAEKNWQDMRFADAQAKKASTDDESSK